MCREKRMRKSVANAIKRFVRESGVENRMHIAPNGKTRVNPFNVSVNRIKRAYLRLPHNRRSALMEQLGE